MSLCTISDCDREIGRHGARGMCNAHYKRWRYGSPPMNAPVQKRGEGWISSHGYRYIGSIGEHRLIMEQLLGRKFHYNEVVHHRDGNTLNNDPENLEVLDRGDHIRRHTAGKTNEQRAAEKAEHGYCLAGKP